MEILDVTLEGYDWTWYFITAATIAIVGIAFFALMSILDNGYDDGYFYGKLFGTVLTVLALFIVSLAAVFAAAEHDTTQRKIAMADAGITNPLPVEESRVSSDVWTGSLGGQFVIVTFVPAGGEQWRMTGVIDD